MVFPPQGAGGIRKLSELEIDADKDWNDKTISNVLIDMQGNVIKNLGAPVNDNDAAPYYIAKKTETIVVAAYNSLRKFKADYVCDGVDDQEEINSAISEVASTGGTVLLLEGTYYVTGSINLASKIRLCGQGTGTVIKIPDSFNRNIYVFYANEKNQIVIENLVLDGNKDNQSAGYMWGGRFNASEAIIRNCIFRNLNIYGIFFEGGSYRVFIHNNKFEHNGTACGFNDVHNTFVIGNCITDSYLNNGIEIHAGTEVIVSNNIIKNSSYCGIWLQNITKSQINNNLVLYNSTLYDIFGDGIHICGCYNNGYNIFFGNTVRTASDIRHRYGIRINDSSCVGNFVIANDLYKAGGIADFSDAGTGTIYHCNRTTGGWVL